MNQTKKLLDQRVLEWLGEQGYPLEMLVAQSFQERGFGVLTSSYYEDFETGKPREIDVIARLHSNFDSSIIFQISCQIECKLASDKPWVLFMPQHLEELDRRLMPIHIVNSKVMLYFFKNIFKDSSVLSDLNKLPLFQINNIGYGVTQAFTTGQDVPYQACMSALKASIANAIEIDSYVEGNSQIRLDLCGISIPVVIIDSNLFSCYMDQNKKLVVEPIEIGALRWRQPNTRKASPLIYIVTKTALGQFVEDFKVTAQGFIKIVQERMPTLVEAVKSARQEDTQVFL